MTNDEMRSALAEVTSSLQEVAQAQQKLAEKVSALLTPSGSRQDEINALFWESISANTVAINAMREGILAATEVLLQLKERLDAGAGGTALDVVGTPPNEETEGTR